MITEHDSNMIVNRRKVMRLRRFLGK